ncbi:hypothetical protein D9M68_757500 [compost metagenome]
MYVLLLYTISPALLPTKIRQTQDKKTEKFNFSFSMSLRIFVVILLAVIIAQPLNVLILKPQSNTLAFDIKHLLSTNPLATFITLIVIGFFLLPIRFKYSIRNLGEFYEKKGQIKKMIIEDNYDHFKQEYRQLLESRISHYNKNRWQKLVPLLPQLERSDPLSYQKHFNEIKRELEVEQINKYEYWANPPYRTSYKIQKKGCLSETELLNRIYPETN